MQLHDRFFADGQIGDTNQRVFGLFVGEGEATKRRKKPSDQCESIRSPHTSPRMKKEGRAVKYNMPKHRYARAPL
jgi:hypothetical protein